jgi:hypothetical protein
MELINYLYSTPGPKRGKSIVCTEPHGLINTESFCNSSQPPPPALWLQILNLEHIQISKLLFWSNIKRRNIGNEYVGCSHGLESPQRLTVSNWSAISGLINEHIVNGLVNSLPLSDGTILKKIDHLLVPMLWFRIHVLDLPDPDPSLFVQIRILLFVQIRILSSSSKTSKKNL